MGRRLTHWAFIAFVVWALFDSLRHHEGSLMKDSWMVLGDVFPEVSNPNMLVYNFTTSHMKFIPNKHVKLDITRIDTQSHFKANLSNVMDVLGC